MLKFLVKIQLLQWRKFSPWPLVETFHTFSQWSTWYASCYRPCLQFIYVEKVMQGWLPSVFQQRECLCRLEAGSWCDVNLKHLQMFGGIGLGFLCASASAQAQGSHSQKADWVLAQGFVGCLMLALALCKDKIIQNEMTGFSRLVA